MIPIHRHSACVAILACLGFFMVAQDGPYDPDNMPKGTLLEKALATIPPTEGMGSWYGGKFHGRPTASGEIFNKNDFTCAHLQLEFGTRLLVTNLWNDRQVVVRVNDRGPYAKQRIIDLSEAAAGVLDMKIGGVAKLKIEVVDRKTKLGEYGGQTPTGGQTPPSPYPDSKLEVENPDSNEVVATIQVASYSQADNANQTADRLLASGFKPEFERVPDPKAPLSRTLIRVIIRGIEGKDVETVRLRLADLGYRDVIIRKETKVKN